MKMIEFIIANDPNPVIAQYPLTAAPPERSPLFFPTFRAMSIAVQKELRERIAAVYFQDSGMFATPGLAYPVLVYAASRPFCGKQKPDFTLDLLDETVMSDFSRKAKRSLGSVLAGVVARLRAERRPQLVDPYLPYKALDIVASVQTKLPSRKILYNLLAGETALIEELLEQAGFGALNRRDQRKRSAALEKNWDYHLRRMCRGHDMRHLRPRLLEVASRALHARQSDWYANYKTNPTQTEPGCPLGPQGSVNLQNEPNLP